MESSLSGEAKPSQLISYGGDDPLAIAMAQSGIEASDQWSFLDLRPEADGGVDFGPVTSFRSGADFSPVTSFRSGADFSPVTSLRSGADFGPVTSLGCTADFGQLTCLQPSDDEQMEDRLLGQMAEEEEEEEEMEDGTAVSEGALDNWLSSYYYTVDDGSADPDDPDLDPAGYSDLSPASVLPRLVASLGWTDVSRRPPYTYEELAALAICSSPERKLTAGLAAQFVRQVYPFYRQHEDRLQASLEQALFASPFFRRVSGRGPLARPWTVTAEGERRLAAAVQRRLGTDGPWRPARPAWQEDHNYAAEEPGTAGGRRRVKLATKT